MKDINIYQKVYFNWWRELDKTLFFIIISLFLLGLFFSLVSTSLIASDRFNTNSYKFFLKHFIYISMGFCIVFSLSYLNIKKLLLISKLLFVICFSHCVSFSLFRIFLMFFVFLYCFIVCFFIYLELF